MTAHSEREWILLGMAERCATQGFGTTTVEDVCDSAGVSRASFDDLFAGKDACLAATVESAVEQARKVLFGATSAQPWAANLCDGATALLRFLAGHPGLAHVVLVEAQPAGGRAAVLVESARAELRAFLEHGRGYAAEEIPASASRGALAGAEALIVSRLAAGEADGLGSVTPDVVYMLAVPFLGIAEARRLAAGTTRRRHLRAVA